MSSLCESPPSPTETKPVASLRQLSKSLQFVQEVQQHEESARLRAASIRLKFESQRVVDIILQNNSSKACELLSSKSISIDALNTQCSKQKCCPLHVACECGKVEVVELLLQLGSSPFVLDNNNENALLCCVGRTKDKEAGNACARALLLSATDVDDSSSIVTFVNAQRTTDGSTALHCACFKDDIELVNLLIQYGASKHIPNHRGTTAVELAKKLNSLPEIQKILRDSDI
jgi:ankyrin repeat protein